MSSPSRRECRRFSVFASSVFVARATMMTWHSQSFFSGLSTLSCALTLVFGQPAHSVLSALVSETELQTERTSPPVDGSG